MSIRHIPIRVRRPLSRYLSSAGSAIKEWSVGIRLGCWSSRLVASVNTGYQIRPLSSYNRSRLPFAPAPDTPPPPRSAMSPPRPQLREPVSLLLRDPVVGQQCDPARKWTHSQRSRSAVSSGVSQPSLRFLANASCLSRAKRSPQPLGFSICRGHNHRRNLPATSPGVSTVVCRSRLSSSLEAGSSIRIELSTMCVHTLARSTLADQLNARPTAFGLQRMPCNFSSPQPPAARQSLIS